MEVCGERGRGKESPSEAWPTEGLLRELLSLHFCGLPFILLYSATFVEDLTHARSWLFSVG